MKETEVRKREITFIIIAVLLFSYIAGFSLLRIHSALDMNVSRRALSELRASSSEQTYLIKNELQRIFDMLDDLASFFEDTDYFDYNSNQPFLQTYIAANHWKLIGLADAEGNAVDECGNSLGNIAERSYFSDVISGASARKMDYIPDTTLHDGPKLIFSVPNKKDGIIVGVLFVSIDSSVLNRVLLGNTEFDEITSIYLVDSNGFILCSNQNGRKHLNGDNYFEDHKEGTYSSGMSEKQLRKDLAGHIDGSYSLDHDGQSENILYTWTGVNDWYVISLADMEMTKEKYEENASAIKGLFAYIFLAFTGMLLILISYMVISWRKMAKSEKRLLLERERNDRLLDESNSEQFVYDVKTSTVTGKGSLITKHDNPEPKDFLSTINLMTSLYPELENECALLVRAVHEVVETGKTKIVDRPVLFRKKYTWIKMILAPYMEDGKNVSHVFCSMLDTTYMHQEFKKSAEMLENLPGGSHRCYLSDPIHLEAVSDGLSRLLGYRKEEIYRITNGEYTQLIVEEDRQRFTDFVYRLAAQEGTETCEYRMICKNGSTVYVSDTMESVRNEDGIMYGYSAVTDISRKAAELEAAREKIKESEERENYLLNERLMLASAAKVAYSIIISANLTQNTYSVMEYDHQILQYFKKEGKLDDFIEDTARSIPDTEQAVQYRKLFSREALIEAYRRGQKSVFLRHKQNGHDGEVHWIDVEVIFVPADDTADIRAIVLACSADEKQAMIDELQQTLRKESVYREALLARSTGYMEINFSTGFIESDILYRDKGSEYKKFDLHEFDEPIKYDDFERWWAEHVLISDKEAYIRMSNADYFLRAFKKGIRYIEVPTRIKGTGSEEVQDCVENYFLSQEELTGDIKGVCILHDTTELENQRKEIRKLTDDLIDARIKNSVSQMQPHFLYNALASIREIILDDPKYASDLICDFTTHLRACVRSLSNNDLVPFSEELKNIKAYVNIEKMRFGDRLKIQYDIRTDDFMIVPLTIQPLVENAIRHGIYQRGAKGGLLSVSTAEEGDFRIITVQDDGVGFDYEKMKSEVESGERDSTGIANLSFRLEKILGAKLTVQSENGVGTKIVVKIPTANQHRGGTLNEDDNR